MLIPCPRLMIAGTSGDAGKTVITVGLARALRGQGISVTVFKKGPDYIDASWLSAAAGREARNLDTFLAEPETVKRSFITHAVQDGVNLIEGNRGLHDGLDVRGSHSSAALSKLIDSPVILVQDVTKTTRSAAAFVLGSRLLDEGVNISAVILNRVAGSRHESLVRRSIETYCGLPVVGAIPKLSPQRCIPSRHLGLVMPREEATVHERIESLGRMVEENLDLPQLMKFAQDVKKMVRDADPPEHLPKRGKVRIGYLSDSAFSFYYPENLEALRAAGAELIALSALEASELPDCDGLYIGGGFPETQATALARNESFRDSLRRAAEAGLPMYAECGGLLYLAETLSWKGSEYPMTGIFPLRFRMEERPQGHGYVSWVVDGENPFFERGIELKGHEFHYSRPESRAMECVFDIKRGTGCGNGRDGLLRWNVLGTYFHVHALGCPAWAQGVVGAAERHRKE